MSVVFRKGYADHRQVVSAALQVELKPAAGLLDEDLSVADVDVPLVTSTLRGGFQTNRYRSEYR